MTAHPSQAVWRVRDHYLFADGIVRAWGKDYVTGVVGWRNSWPIDSDSIPADVRTELLDAWHRWQAWHE